MRIYALILTWLILLPLGCSRKEPLSNSPTTEIKTLQPQAAINLLPDIPEPSGIAYNAKNNTLMVVSDSRAEIFEIDLTGALKSKKSTNSADLEGIAVTPNGDTLFVVEERNQMVVCYGINGSRIGSFPVKVATLDNNALEGVTIDDQHHLIVVNEKNPRLLLEFSGSQEIARIEITAVADLSDICYDQMTDALWIVSDESRKVIAVAKNGQLLGQWLIPFDKGEGIAFAHGRMYIANDAEGKIYVFERPVIE